MLLAIAFRDGQNDFFDEIAGAARQRGTKLRIGGDDAGIKSEIAQNRCRKGRVLLSATPEIACVQDRKASGVPLKELAKGRHKVRLAVFAQPLDFVFIAPGMEAEELGNTGIKPAEGIWIAQRPEEAKLIAFPEVKRAGAHVAPFVER